MTANPLDYVPYLKEVGTKLRVAPERAAELARQISALQAELDAFVRETDAMVAAHWTPAQIAEARRDAKEWER